MILPRLHNLLVFCFFVLCVGVSCGRNTDKKAILFYTTDVYADENDSLESIVFDEDVEAQSGSSTLDNDADEEGKSILIEHTGFVISYNLKNNAPNWVAWELTPDKTDGVVSRKDYDFHEDEYLPPSNQVFKEDYNGSLYDRGHMCPAGDMKWSNQAMYDCFSMSNVCPQTSVLNQRWWEHLERACRRWAQREGRIHIWCGPIYNNNVTPVYIGRNVKVRVPDGFFKVVLSKKVGEEKAIGFIYSNSESRQTMEDAATTVDEVEMITGFTFFSDDDIGNRNNIKSNANIRLWH